jgi:hypothetical protein
MESDPQFPTVTDEERRALLVEREKLVAEVPTLQPAG